jgi:hypothetical protein
LHPLLGIPEVKMNIWRDSKRLLKPTRLSSEWSTT